MNFLLIALGSHGDVHPFVGLGLSLRARGHAVTVAANGHFQSLIERVGLGFLPLGTEEDYRRLTANPDLWHSFRAFKAVVDGVLETVRPLYEMVQGFASRHPRTGPRAAAVVSSSLGFGARIAEEKLGVPTTMAHLSPLLLRSLHDTSVYPGSPIGPRTPGLLKGMFFSFGDRHVIDKLLAPPLNAFRAELGLPPVGGILRDWIHSPRLTIGLFPDWFAPPQPDWPPQARLTGFPLYDERGVEPLPAELLQFLDGDVERHGDMGSGCVGRVGVRGAEGAGRGGADRGGTGRGGADRGLPAAAMKEGNEGRGHEDASRSSVTDPPHSPASPHPHLLSLPIAFTPGSAMWQGRRFFEAAAEACRVLGRRGLLLTRHADHVPPNLPPGVRHVPYAPFSELLPRCAALVHHGGIGTSAQAMAAGLPQVVMPMAHDQPDNANRMKRLGVARVLPPRKFRGPALARVLRDVLASAEIGESCRAVAAKFVGADALGKTCELVEGLARR